MTVAKRKNKENKNRSKYGCRFNIGGIQMTNTNDITIENLLTKASSYIKEQDDLNKIKSAYNYAEEKHFVCRKT